MRVKKLDSTIIIMLSIIVEYCCGDSNQLKQFLGHFRFNHAFTFSSRSVCPAGSNTYVVGARVRFSGHLKEEVPVVTAMEVICSDGLRSEVNGDDQVILEKSAGNWSEIKRCPNGKFATEVLYHHHNLKSWPLSASDVVYKAIVNAKKDYDLRYIFRRNYISGVSFYCAYRGGAEGMDDGKERANYFTLGKETGYYLKMHCPHDRAITGLHVTNEEMLAYNNEKRAIPVLLSIICETIFNPGRNCHPELAWENVKFSDMECNDSTTESSFNSSTVPIPKTSYTTLNLTCKVIHLIGPTLNDNISNLEGIGNTYFPAGLMETGGLVIIPKLLSSSFRSDWTKKYKLSPADYTRVVKNSNMQKYSRLQVGHSSFQVFEATKDLLDTSNVKRKITGDIAMQMKLKVLQLVGYCSLYKIYFPMFKSELQRTVQKQLNGISMNILFEQLV